MLGFSETYEGVDEDAVVVEASSSVEAWFLESSRPRVGASVVGVAGVGLDCRFNMEVVIC